VRAVKSMFRESDTENRALVHPIDAEWVRPMSTRGGILEVETRRLNERYVIEIVERFGLCPWADRARREGRVTTLVFDQTDPDLFDPTLAAMHALAPRTACDVALFIYPEIGLNRLDFEHFARKLRALDAARHPPGQIPFAMAAFHPDALPVLADPDRLVPFLRRTPDPTLQLVRESTLSRLRGDVHGTSFYGPTVFVRNATGQPAPEPDVRERIARANYETVSRVGVETLEAVFDDILRDRDETRARLALSEIG
jgi:hypothetical protein